MICPGSTPSRRRPQRGRWAALAAVVCLVSAACGKKGPPLPPLVKLPAAPADFRAERRGDRVDLAFTVPAANTDNTRPANLARVDVYAITSGEPVPPEQIVKRGVRVASVPVKAPRDPDATIDEDEPAADLEPLEGTGLDQGAPARVAEALTAAAFEPASRTDGGDGGGSSTMVPSAGPLLPPPQTALTRTYVSVGLSTRDKRGPFSKTVPVPLVPAPPVPPPPTISYDEQSITVRWAPIEGRVPIQREAARGELASTPIGAAAPPLAYHVYDAAAGTVPVRLTAKPVSGTSFSDARLAWGAERCYIVRSVEIVGDAAIESDARPPVCETLRDTFPPAAPTNLQSSPLDGAINLIWDANSEKDLAGYIVLRGPVGGALEPVTDAPLQVTTYLDRVPAGARYVYVVKAVDTAGNVSEPSASVEEAARE